MQIINIHPILVHFPIALLSIYSLIEIISLIPIIKKQTYWFYVKAVLVIVGALSTLPTILAGIVIKDLFIESSTVVELHEKFAIATTVLFFVLAGCYVIVWLKPLVKKWHLLFLITLQKFIFRYHLEIILALIGLILVTITGALGGIIAFGAHTDPFAQFIYSLLFH